MEMNLIYEYLIKRQEPQPLEEKNLYYVFLPTPEYWEVQVEPGYRGSVVNMGEKKATIFFKEPVEKRFVQRVEWNTSKGVVYKIDYYNRYGYAYCTEYLNTDGTSRMKEYYTSQQKLVACKNFSNGVVSLYEQDHIVAMFDTEADLEKKLREENDDNICI